MINYSNKNNIYSYVYFTDKQGDSLAVDDQILTGMNRFCYFNQLL